MSDGARKILKQAAEDAQTNIPPEEITLTEVMEIMTASSRVTDQMIEDGCRGMYGKHWDGPPDKMPGEEMKAVWRKLARSCLEAALEKPR